MSESRDSERENLGEERVAMVMLCLLLLLFVSTRIIREKDQGEMEGNQRKEGEK